MATILVVDDIERHGRLLESLLAPDDHAVRKVGDDAEALRLVGIILGFSEILLAEAVAGDPRRGDLEESHKAATAALDLLARLFPVDADTPQ